MLIADAVLALHALVVLFNVAGLLMIGIGGLRGWAWTRHRGFRLTHLAVIGFVMIETILGVTCPLTLLEDWLRGVATQQSFVQRWASALIYWNAPPWLFALIYVAFLFAVIGAWLTWPPSPAKRPGRRG